MLLDLPIIVVLPTFMGNMGRVDVITPRMSVNRGSTISGVESCIIEGVCCGINQELWSCLPLCAIH